MDVKLFLTAKYLNRKEKISGMRPVLTKVAVECCIVKTFVVKIEWKLMEKLCILLPEEIYMACVNLIRPGSRIMSNEEIFIHYLLYWQDPTWSLKSYVYWLFCCTGMIVLEITMSRWFNHAFPVRGQLCVPNLVPFDKNSGRTTWRSCGNISSTLAR